MEKLAEFIRRRMDELRVTDRDVADASKGYVTYGTVNGTANAKNNDLRLSTIYGIALGLQVPKEHLIAIAFEDDPSERNLLSKTEQVLIYYFRRLPFETQAFFLQSMQSLCAQDTSADDVDPAIKDFELSSSANEEIPIPQKGGIA